MKWWGTTTTEARSVCGEVESHVATLAAVADVSATRATKEISNHVKEVAEYSDAQAPCVAADVNLVTGTRNSSGCD